MRKNKRNSDNSIKINYLRTQELEIEMISILIPAYNYVAYPLAKELSRQADGLAGETDVSPNDIEIIVADDASTDNTCRRANEAIASLPHCRFIGLTENMGRSRIRNFLADQAQREWMLIADCDGLPTDDQFLKRYIEAIQANPDVNVICGSIIHPSSLPSPEVSLRYSYEKAAEKNYTAAKRNLQPYASFRTFNVLIKSNAFNHVRFDEDFRQYGYEDVLFGMHLKEAGFNILHIDNPLENQDIEPNSIFLKKTEEAIQTLSEQADKLGESVYLHKIYTHLKRFGLTPLIRMIFQWSRPLLKRNLTGTSPNLLLFAFYKLGYYSVLRKKMADS